MAPPPISIRHQRPYASIEELVAAEGWAIGKGTFVLVGHEDLEPGTTVRSELVLESGEQLIRAEGSVLRNIPGKGSRPGGPQLKIQRLTPGTRDFLKHVQHLKEQRSKMEGANGEDSSPSAERPSAPSLPPPESMEMIADGNGQGNLQDPPGAAALAEDARKLLARLAERTLGRVDAPAERDALLNRLRTRRRAG